MCCQHLIHINNVMRFILLSYHQWSLPIFDTQRGAFTSTSPRSIFDSKATWPHLIEKKLAQITFFIVEEKQKQSHQMQPHQINASSTLAGVTLKFIPIQMSWCHSLTLTLCRLLQCSCDHAAILWQFPWKIELVSRYRENGWFSKNCQDNDSVGSAWRCMMKRLDYRLLCLENWCHQYGVSVIKFASGC